MSEGTDKLIKRILADAEADAQRTISLAEEKADAIEAEAERRVDEIRTEGEEQAKTAENEVIFLAKKNAELEAKKADLAMRHTVIDEAFAAALTALRGMNASAAEDFLKKLIFRETSGGEVIRPTALNESIVRSVVEAINAMLRKENAQPLTVGEVTDAIPDGVIIEGRGFIKKCSYEELLLDLRERELGQIGDILF